MLLSVALVENCYTYLFLILLPFRVLGFGRIGF